MKEKFFFVQCAENFGYLGVCLCKFLTYYYTTNLKFILYRGLHFCILLIFANRELYDCIFKNVKNLEFYNEKKEFLKVFKKVVFGAQLQFFYMSKMAALLHMKNLFRTKFLLFCSNCLIFLLLLVQFYFLNFLCTKVAAHFFMNLCKQAFIHYLVC